MGTQRQSVVNIYIYILCNSNILLINEGVYNIHTLSLLFKGCQVEVMEEVEWGVWYQNKSIFSTVHVTRFRSRVWHKENRQEGRKQCISPLKPFFHKDRRCTESCGAPGHPLLKATEPLLLSYTLRQPTLSVLQKAKRCSNFSPPWHAQHWVKIWKEVG